LPALGLEPLAGDTLQDSRERVAARWFALKGVFEQSGAEFAALPPARPGEVRTPVLAVFSLAGGVGKTSLVATLGRALSLQGESVVLTDTTAHGLLPFYFGARELRAGVVRAFPPPADKAGQPISLVIYDAAASIAEELHQNVLAEEILRNGTGSHRLLLDLSSGSSWLVYRMVNLHPTVLVPITPDMNSVISLQAVERVFRGIVDSAGRPLLPYYLLNQFDAALPLHLDVREVFRRKLGDRLLPFAIRRSPAVSEALAEGMTVVDYAPSEAVAQDFLAVAAWLRTLSPPARDGLRGLRWGER
jgi:cellulose synthase operon protein YhjQ